MRRTNGTTALFALLLVCLAATGFLGAQQAPAGVGTGTQRPGKAADNPVFGPLSDFDRPLPDNPATRALRVARNHKYDQPAGGRLSPNDIGTHQLKDVGDENVILQLPLSGTPAPDPLPVATSDAVIVGDVMTGESFLSNDKITIYSEFGVRVGEVLKNSGDVGAAPGAEVAVTRYGGRLRFPSGRIAVRGRATDGCRRLVVSMFCS